MICPKCKFEISHIDFDVTGTCKAQIWESDVKANKPSDYDIDCLTDSVEYDNFCCPECNEIIALSEEDAIEMLKKEVLEE